MEVCGFNEAWIGECKAPVEPGARCAKHAGRTCASDGPRHSRNFPASNRRRISASGRPVATW